MMSGKENKCHVYLCTILDYWHENFLHSITSKCLYFKTKLKTTYVIRASVFKSNWVKKIVCSLKTKVGWPWENSGLLYKNFFILIIICNYRSTRPMVIHYSEMKKIRKKERKRWEMTSIWISAIAVKIWKWDNL